ncbi:arginase [Rhodobacteraceae bacterium]|nr:arginase [Paracoccaceae bacterium]
MGQDCVILGAPVGTGAGQSGCQMGPEAYRTAGLVTALQNLDCSVTDLGDVVPQMTDDVVHELTAKNLEKAIAWTKALEASAFDSFKSGQFPIFAGGDHSLSMGTVAGAARYASSIDRPFFLLWLDAHPDFHRLDTSDSGNIHGMPVAYVTGQPGFEPFFPTPTAPVEFANICMMGIRSVDGAEHSALVEQGVAVHDMRRIDEFGVARPLTEFLNRVSAENGMLHVSLDVDFLDPSIAPAVGTTVPGGATFREAHLIMEILHESGLVSSLDLVELNPFLDHAGRTARLMVDLTTSLMGKTVMDRPTRSY